MRIEVSKDSKKSARGYFSENSCGFKPRRRSFDECNERARVLKYMFARILHFGCFSEQFLSSRFTESDPIGIKINRFVIFENLLRSKRRR